MSKKNCVSALVVVTFQLLFPFILASGGYDDSSSSFGSYGGSSLGGGDGYSHGMASGYHEPHYPPQPYKFGYDIKDGYGGTLTQNEEGDSYGNKKGSYGYTDSYGIYRHVEYIADKNGFRATIKTNEPGTANQNPAAAYIHSDALPAHFESTYKSSGSHGDALHMAPAPVHEYESARIFKAASYPVPSYIGLHSAPFKPPAASISSSVTVAPNDAEIVAQMYKMPAIYLKPQTLYKSISYA